MDDEAGHRAALERGFGHPQTQGKVERFHGELQRAVERRRPRAQDWQSWLEEFRWEHNQVRPHEALGMETPAAHWQPSQRRYDANPPAWEYPAGSRVLKVDSDGKIKLQRPSTGSSAWRLRGQYVQLVTIEATGAGVLLPNPGPGTRPRQPALDDRRSLVANRVP